MKQYSAKRLYLRIAPRKVRLVADLVRSKPVDEALYILDLSTKRASMSLAKLLRSAAQNAKSDQNDLTEHDLRIVELTVDQGPILRRFHAVSRGRAHSIDKKTSHITIVLQSNKKPAAKKPKAKKPATPVKEKTT